MDQYGQPQMPQFNLTMAQSAHSAYPQGMGNSVMSGMTGPMGTYMQQPQQMTVRRQLMGEIEQWKASIGKDWGCVLEPLLDEAEGKTLVEIVEKERRSRLEANSLNNSTIFVCPPASEVFFWTQPCRIQDVKVVIVGHDPYPQMGQPPNPQFSKAHGLAFSVRHGWIGKKKNQRDSHYYIFEAVKKDYPYFVDPGHHNLTEWAKQGVLLLNCLLTVCGEAGSHAGRGWEEITDEVIKYISKNVPSVVFLIWGKDAEEKLGQIDNVKYRSNPRNWEGPESRAGKSKETIEEEMEEAVDRYHRSELQKYHCHSVIVSSHPDPRSAGIDFLHTNHFFLANKWLELNGREPINWTKL